MNAMQGQSAGKDLKLNEELMHHLAGFVDGEGAFIIEIRKTLDTKFGFTITPLFKISQHKDSAEILYILQKTLECGKIFIKHGQTNQLVLDVKKRKNLSERIIPFFQKYPLIVKQKQFQLFSEIVKMINNNEHRTDEGFQKIVNLTFRIKGKGKRKHTKEEILEKVLNNPQRLYVENKNN